MDGLLRQVQCAVILATFPPDATIAEWGETRLFAGQWSLHATKQAMVQSWKRFCWISPHVVVLSYACIAAVSALRASATHTLNASGCL